MSLEDLVAADTTNFHDVVNAIQDMYDEIESLPSDTDQMVSATIGIVQSHVGEVWPLQESKHWLANTDASQARHMT